MRDFPLVEEEEDDRARRREELAGGGEKANEDEAKSATATAGVKRIFMLFQRDFGTQQVLSKSFVCSLGAGRGIL